MRTFSTWRRLASPRSMSAISLRPGKMRFSPVVDSTQIEISQTIGRRIAPDPPASRVCGAGGRGPAIDPRSKEAST
jgi:hypothetical protein